MTGLWQYLILQVTSSGLIFPRVPTGWAYMLNRLGSEGWELVAILPVSRGGARTDRIVATFKRPQLEEEALQPSEKKGWLGRMFLGKQDKIIQDFEKQLEAYEGGRSLLINLEGDLG